MMYRSRYITFAITLAAVAAASAYENPLEHGMTQAVTNSWNLGNEQLQVGTTTENNTLVVSASGEVSTSYALVGAGADNNIIHVDGGKIQATDGVIVGDIGANNLLLVDGAGAVTAYDVMVGRSSQGNTAMIADSGSLFSVSNAVTVGYLAGQNTLIVETGGVLSSGSGTLGTAVQATENQINVQDSGSEWNVENELMVGDKSAGNSLLIQDGAVVNAGSVILGSEVTAVSNSIEVAGVDSALNVDNTLTVGASAEQSLLQVVAGSRVGSDYGVVGADADSNQVLIDGVDSTWDVAHTLTVGAAGSQNELLITAGGQVLASNLVVATQQGTQMNAVRVDDSSVQVGGDLLVGEGGSLNLLEISNGGQLVAGRAGIGFSDGADNNVVVVDGLGSSLIAEELNLGGYQDAGWQNGGRGNQLLVRNGASVDAGWLNNRNGSTVSVDASSLLTTSNYYQDADSTLVVGVVTNSFGEPVSSHLSVSDTAEFEAEATLMLNSEVGELAFGSVYSNLLVEASTLVVGGVTNANTMDLQRLNMYGSLVTAMFYEYDQNIYAQYGRIRIAESAGFSPDSDMERVSDEIDVQGLSRNPLALTQIRMLDGMSGERQNRELTQLYQHGMATYEHGKSLEGASEAVHRRSSGFQDAQRVQTSAPTGPEGPQVADKANQVWLKAYGNRNNRDGDSGLSSYDVTAYGTLIGYDRSFGNWLFGLAGGYAESSIDQDNGDESDAETGIGMLYAAWGTESWFADMNLSYGRSSVDTRSGTSFDTEADFDTDNYLCYFSGGRAINMGRGFSLIPEAAVIAGFYDQESYVESSTLALPRTIDAYDRWSVRTLLGSSVIWENQIGNVLIRPQLRGFWSHEYRSENDQVNYTIVNGGSTHQLLILGPETDLFLLGGGISARFSNGLAFELDLDGYSSSSADGVTLSGRLVYAF